MTRLVPFIKEKMVGALVKLTICFPAQKEERHENGKMTAKNFVVIPVSLVLGIITHVGPVSAQNDLKLTKIPLEGDAYDVAAGMGFLNLTLKNLRIKGEVPSKSKKQIHPEKNLCYFAFKKTIGSQKGDFGGIGSPQRRFQKQFSTTVFKTAA